MPNDMEKWIWKLCQNGMLLHTCVLCWGVMRMYPKATWMVGIPIMIMMS